MRVKREKCEFFTKKTAFLGHIITPGKISMDPEKVRSVIEWPSPKNVKELQAFLGLGNYYRKYIKDYSAVATPLFALLKKDTKYEWLDQQEFTFNRLKEAFTQAPVRAMFNPEQPIVIVTDASNYAIGAILN